jgi:hypothetical protein
MTPREEYLSARFNEFLDRFSPPRSIQNNPTAMQSDADSMLRTVLRFAPKEGYSEWLDAMLSDLQDGMTTRSWPAPGELTKACRSKASATFAPDSLVESAAIERMVAWHIRFKSEMPGHGYAARTAEMIRSGVLANEREAQWSGYALGPEQAERAKGQKMGREEWNHHVAVTARLRDISEAEAAVQIREESGKPVSVISTAPKAFPAQGSAT